MYKSHSPTSGVCHRSPKIMTDTLNRHPIGSRELERIMTILQYLDESMMLDVRTMNSFDQIHMFASTYFYYFDFVLDFQMVGVQCNVHACIYSGGYIISVSPNYF